MKRFLSTAAALGVLVSLAADITATAAPVVSSIENGKVFQNGNTTLYQVGNGNKYDVAKFNHDTYNLNAGETAIYGFTNHHQTAINTVSATGGLSQIYGNIKTQSMSLTGDCNGCTYHTTGKVILSNPNGILFGAGANVDVNSFAATNMNVTYTDKGQDGGILNFTKYTGTKTSDAINGVKILDGATVKGGKALAIVGNGFVDAYEGSKLLTNTTTEGKMYLVTSDGINFNYQNDSSIASHSTPANSANKMTIQLNGNIETGHLDVQNYSSNNESLIGMKNAAIKAVYAASANDGSIILSSGNKIVSDHSTVTSEGNNGGTNTIKLKAPTIDINNGSELTAYSTILADATGSDNGQISVKDSTLKSKKYTVQLQSGNKSSVVNSTLEGNNYARVYGGNSTVVDNSTITAKTKDLTLAGDNVEVKSSNLSAAAGTSKVTATNGDAVLENSTNTAKTINVYANGTNGSVKFDKSTNKADTIAVSSYKTIELGKNKNIIQAANGAKTFDGDKVTLKSTNGDVLLKGADPYSSIKDGAAVTLSAAKGSVNVEKTSGDLAVKNTTFVAGDKVLLKADKGNLTVANSNKFSTGDYLLSLEAGNGGSVKTSGGYVNLANKKTQIIADKDINVSINGKYNASKGLVASTNTGSITVKSNGTLAVAGIVSAKDVTLTAKDIVKGEGYDFDSTAGGYFADSTPRGYIEVGKANDNEGNLTLKINGTTTTDYNNILETEGLATNGYVYDHHINVKSDDTGKLYLVQKAKYNQGGVQPGPVDIEDITKAGESEVTTTSGVDITNSNAGTAGTVSGSSPKSWNPFAFLCD